MRRVTPLLRVVVLAAALMLMLGVVAADPAGAWARRRPHPAVMFDRDRAVAHAGRLAALGSRRAGSAAERRAVAYCAETLRGLGYTTTTLPVGLPGGRTSYDVIAVKPGRSGRRVVIGAHLDSKSGSPGANDNASGVGTVLELARVLKGSDLQPTVVFALFGAEETLDANPNHHHYGSRAYVARLTPAQRRNVSGMISVDMIGYGTRFYVRTMGVGPQTLQSRLRVFAASRGVALRYLKDPGRSGWSDHEPFERAGIPVAWLEWKDDPYYHTSRDTAARLQPRLVGTAGTMLTDWVRGLTAGGLGALRP